MTLVVADDWMGFTVERLDQRMSSGIGLANVRERLQVIYGTSYQLKLTSEPGKGTTARMEIPELVAASRISA
jgi:sensor histidine kinase YesM